MPISKIDDAALAGQGRFHESLADVPGLAADDMKKFFDYVPRRVLIPKVNELVDPANAVAGKLERYFVCSDKYDGSEIFTATLQTDGGPKTLTLKPYFEHGYVEGVELSGDLPLRFGSNVQIGFEFPKLTLDDQQTFGWEEGEQCQYSSSTLPDFIAFHADSPLITLSALCANPDDIVARSVMTLTRATVDGYVAFVSPVFYDYQLNSAYQFLFTENYYYCVRIF